VKKRKKNSQSKKERDFCKKGSTQKSNYLMENIKNTRRSQTKLRGLYKRNDKKQETKRE
jgi:hypothetical protein